MERSQPRTFEIGPDLEGETLAAALRALVPNLSWTQAKKLILDRQIEINGVITLNDARRLAAGESISILDQPQPPLPDEHAVRLLHIDPDLLVVDKPAGVLTLRRREEEDFSEERKELQPSLEELIQRLLPGGRRRGRPTHLFPVHRLDRDTSGLMIFALSPRARDALIEQFSIHAVLRSYIAVVHGRIESPRIFDTWMIRDRGDGLRGSAAQSSEAKRAVTHIAPIEHLGDEYTIVKCELETGRTHQIRIHLAEAGHMLCGEKLYLRPKAGAPVVVDQSGAPRQALHSGDLKFTHPITAREMQFHSELPRDLRDWLNKLRARPPGK